MPHYFLFSNSFALERLREELTCSILQIASSRQSPSQWYRLTVLPKPQHRLFWLRLAARPWMLHLQYFRLSSRHLLKAQLD